MNIRKKLKSISFIKNIYENVLYSPIINLYKDNYKKRCLLSYSVFPFKQKQKKFIHPNYIENYTLAEEIRKHGYTIDVYNNTYKKNINYSKYDLIIGEGLPISNYFLTRINKKIDTIYYATGSHPFIQNFNSQKALLNFASKHDLYIKNSARLVPESWGISASLSQKYMILGNEITENTFKIFNSNSEKYLLNPPFYATNIITDFSKKSPKDFLWFGSYGLIHKDLNTVLDVFIKHPELNLHICGRIEEEKEFMSVYNESLISSSNIHLHGYVNVNSDYFKNLMETCSFTILSSCAEGCSTAIATVMGNGGLIPIVSKECGIDIKNGEYVISGDNESIEKAVLKASNYADSDILMYSEENIKFVNEEFSITTFKRNVEKILNSFLE